MLSLVLLRHGQTDPSREHRYCGELDAPLNETGRAMADAIAEALGQEPWTALYSSPKIRARQTIAPLSERLGLEVRVEEGLREITYGEWDGRLESELRATDGERLAAWGVNPAMVAPPGGESGFAIASRATEVVEAIRCRHDEGRVLVASHKATIRVLVCSLLGIPLQFYRTRIGCPTGSMTTIEFREAGPLLRGLGELSHLPLPLRNVEGS